MNRLVLVLLAVGSLPGRALADDMDISLARLRIPTNMNGMEVPGLPAGCTSLADQGGMRDYCPDNDAWRRLMAGLGFASAPPILAPARTLGYGGFYFAVEGWLTGIPRDADYWRVGTEGDAESAVERLNRFPSSVLVWTRVNARKGFPFGFELGTSLGTLIDTSLWAWGLEIKWSIFEGFGSGVLGFLPDVAVRGMVNTMTGDPEFNLTVPSFDIVVSKPFTIAGVGRITPILALQWMWVFADSELVDLTPDVDAYGQCLPVAGGGCSLVGTLPTDADGITRVPGQDYNNNAVFEQVRATRSRLVLGVQGQYRAITLTGTFAFDVVPPSGADADNPEDLERQWSVAAGLGLTY